MCASYACVRGAGYLFLTLKLSFSPLIPSSQQNTRAQTRRGRQANKKKCETTPQDTRNTAFPVILGKYRICLDLYRFSGLSEMLSESCKALLLPDYSLSCCTYPSGISSLTLAHVCPNISTLFLQAECASGSKSHFVTSSHAMNNTPFFITSTQRHYSGQQQPTAKN